nr:MAG TPA: hypothetical protein [Caudoviricetes sp.]
MGVLFWKTPKKEPQKTLSLHIVTLGLFACRL